MNQNPPTRIAILGATGYVGGQLAALLATHPHVRISAATSVRYAGQRLNDVYPALGDAASIELTELDPAHVADEADVVMSALPHGQSAAVLDNLAQRGLPVLDLSADYRFPDPGVYQAAYGQEHPCPDLARTAVYGLPEFDRKRIRGAALVGVPGCYPTATLLALVPLLKGGFADPDAGVVVDAKSGISGAGREAKTANLFCEAAGAVRAYNVGAHRHQPEMAFHAAVFGGRPVSIFFTPQVVPMSRGILASVYVTPAPKKKTSLEQVHAHFTGTYEGSPFARVLPLGSFPDTRQVAGTNRFAIGLAGDPERGPLVALCAIDNLIKGAAGQAVQCLNLMLGHPEETGLPLIGSVA